MRTFDFKTEISKMKLESIVKMIILGGTFEEYTDITNCKIPGDAQTYEKLKIEILNNIGRIKKKKLLTILLYIM